MPCLTSPRTRRDAGSSFEDAGGAPNAWKAWAYSALEKASRVCADASPSRGLRMRSPAVVMVRWVRAPSKPSRVTSSKLAATSSP
eukprot:5301576-Prymnesium_polylepis.1